MNAQPKSSTPRVDAKVIKTAGGDIVYADDARTLERENATLRAALDAIVYTLTQDDGQLAPSSKLSVITRRVAEARAALLGAA